jgi:tripartite-type tricarboxylate transporter receptor subunit TctC
LPAPVLKALYDAATHALKDPEVARRLADFRSVNGGQSPDAFCAYVQSEMKRWGDIVRVAKITAE